jgi:cell division protein ZapA
VNPQEGCRVRIEILGQEYVIKGTDPPEYIEMLAKSVSQKMEQINRQHPSYTQTKVAVLVALQLADELSKIREDYEKIIEELKVLDKIHKSS